MVYLWSGLLSSPCLRTVLRLCGSRHTSIVCAAEQAAYRSVGSRVSQWLPAPERERRACDQGTFSLVQGAVGAQRRGGLGNPSPLHRQQIDPEADGEEISRKVIPPQPGYTSVSSCLRELTHNFEQNRRLSQTWKQDSYHCFTAYTLMCIKEIK